MERNNPQSAPAQKDLQFSVGPFFIPVLAYFHIMCTIIVISNIHLCV